MVPWWDEGLPRRRLGGGGLPKELNMNAKGIRAPTLYRWPGRLTCRAGRLAWHWEGWHIQSRGSAHRSASHTKERRELRNLQLGISGLSGARLRQAYGAAGPCPTITPSLRFPTPFSTAESPDLCRQASKALPLQRSRTPAMPATPISACAGWLA